MPRLNYQTPRPNPDRHVLPWILGSLAFLLACMLAALLLGQ